LEPTQIKSFCGPPQKRKQTRLSQKGYTMKVGDLVKLETKTGKIYNMYSYLPGNDIGILKEIKYIPWCNYSTCSVYWQKHGKTMQHPLLHLEKAGL